ncbi:MAG: hypothetical protein AAF988_03485 [Pseudomonadota bacterium]
MSNKRSKKKLPPNGLIFLHMKLFRDDTNILPNSSYGNAYAPKGFSWGNIILRLKEERNLTPTQLYTLYDPKYVTPYGRKPRPLPSDQVIYEHMRSVYKATGDIPNQETLSDTAPANWSWQSLYARIMRDQHLRPDDFYKKFEPDYEPPRRRKYDNRRHRKWPTIYEGTMDLMSAYEMISTGIARDNKIPNMDEFSFLFSPSRMGELDIFFQRPADKSLLPKSPDEFIFALALTNRFGEVSLHLVNRRQPVKRKKPFEIISEERAEQLRELRKWARQNPQSFTAN